MDDQQGDAAPIPWYEESWAVVTAGVAGVLVIGVLIYAVMQTSESSVEPSYGPQYYSGYTSTTSGTSTTTSRTTTSRTTTASSTTSSTTTSSTTTTTTTTSEETTTTTTDDETTTSTEPSLDDENPFILNPFATTTEPTAQDG